MRGGERGRERKSEERIRGEEIEREERRERDQPGTQPSSTNKS